jgi:catechol 2,3-dioxygenase-like lactoylglutathione lyase family enzyme
MKLIYAGIRVSDLERSVDFYTKEMKTKRLFKGENKETEGKSLG